MVSENDSAVGLSDPSKEPPKEAFFQAIFASSLVNQIRSSIVIFQTLLSGSFNQIRSSIVIFQTLLSGSCNHIRSSIATVEFSGEPDMLCWNMVTFNALLNECECRGVEMRTTLSRLCYHGFLR